MALKPPDNIYGVTANQAPAPSAHELHMMHLQHLANTGQKAPTPTATTPKPTTPPGTGATAPTTPAMPALPPMPQRQADVTAAPYQDVAPFQFNYNYLNYDSAKKQAEDKYNPLFEQAVKGVQDQQYQNELNSGASAAVRGLGHSGLAQDALTKIAIASQGQIAGLNAQKMSNVADMAQGLVDKDTARGDALRSQMYNEYSDNRNFGYNKYRDSVGDAQYQNSRNDQNYWNAMGQYNTDRNYNRDVFESDRGYNRDVLESDRNYNLDMSKYKSDENQRSIDNAFREKDWSHMSGAEKENMAAAYQDYVKKAQLDLANSIKLKGAKSGDSSNGGNPGAGYLPNNPGALPDDILQQVLRALGGNNYSAISNNGRGFGTLPINTQSPDAKKPRPMAY